MRLPLELAPRRYVPSLWDGLCCVAAISCSEEVAPTLPLQLGQLVMKGRAQHLKGQVHFEVELRGCESCSEGEAQCNGSGMCR